MRSRLSLLVAFGLALAFGAVGCNSPCQDLGDRICNCVAEGQIRTNCKTNVKARIKNVNPSSSEQDYCDGLLGTCPDPNGNVDQCAYMLNTCPGRVACGLALPAPDAVDGTKGCTPVVVPVTPTEVPVTPAAVPVTTPTDAQP
jgi:hypothetical protein